MSYIRCSATPLRKDRDIADGYSYIGHDYAVKIFHMVVNSGGTAPPASWVLKTFIKKK